MHTVIVGGGILGCSVAYHLAQMGARNVLVIERDELGAATTSCSAGLLGQLRSTPEQGEIVQRAYRAIWALQHELEEPVGLRDVGSLRVAETEAREREMADLFGIAQGLGVEVRLIDKAEAQRLVPALDARQARAIGWI